MKQSRRLFRIFDRRFQLELLGLILFMAVTTSSITMLGTWFIVENAHYAAGQVMTVGYPALQALEANNHDVWVMSAIACVVNLIVIVTFGFAFASRTGGIIFRVTRDLNSLADGQTIQPITPRTHDFFTELVAAANRLIGQRKSG